MPQITVQRLFEETRQKLELAWIAGATGGSKLLTSETVQKPTLALIGHLNFVHPNRVQVLAHYLAKTLAEFTTLHGVFMEVMGIGVLITGDAAIGKSELALELITRGHRLVAD